MTYKWTVIQMNEEQRERETIADVLRTLAFITVCAIVCGAFFAAMAMLINGIPAV